MRRPAPIALALACALAAHAEAQIDFSASSQAACVLDSGGGPVEALRCLFDEGPTPATCDGERVPPRMIKLVGRALGLLDRAEHKNRPKTSKRLVKRAARVLKRAGRITRRAANRHRNPINGECANDLSRTIEDAREAALATVKPDNPRARQKLAVILTTDFTNTGSYSTITLDKPRAVRKDLAKTHSDAVGRVFQDRLYVVNRLHQDNIQVIKPGSGQSLAACSIGNGSNPQDIAFASKDKAYVSRLTDGIVTIVDPTVPRTCSGFERRRIDLRRFSDADGSPEPGRMLIVGNRLYVALLRLDQNRLFVPAARGLLAVIDTTTDTLIDVDPETSEIDAIELAAENPFGMAYDAASGKIWVWETGSFFVVGDGGIEAVDPTTNRSQGLIAREEDLGGTVTAAAPYTAARAFAVVADTDFQNRLVAFSPTTGDLLDTLRSAPEYFPDVAVNNRGEVWLADRTVAEPGIRIFDAESGQVVAGPINVGLPPFVILFVQ